VRTVVGLLSLLAPVYYIFILLKSHVSNISCAILQLHNLPGNQIRKLFKPSNDVAIFPAWTFKNLKVLNFVFYG